MQENHPASPNFAGDTRILKPIMITIITTSSNDDMSSNKAVGGSSTSSSRTVSASSLEQDVPEDSIDVTYSAQHLRRLAVNTDSKHIREVLFYLKKDIDAFQKTRNPSFIEVQNFAERCWRANLAYDAHIARLEREKTELNSLMDTTWRHFDMLIRPLWSISDELVPAYNALTALFVELQQLAQQQHPHPKKGDVIDFAKKAQTGDLKQVPVESLSGEMVVQERELWRLQEALHKIESDHVFDGKFFGTGAAAALRAAQKTHPGAALPLEATTANRVPGGQAILSNILAKCYRLIHSIQLNEVSVHPSLHSFQNRLENAVIALHAMREALIVGATVAPRELRLLQEEVDTIDRLRVDGKFLLNKENRSMVAGLPAKTVTAAVPEGQAVMSELLADAYDLIHDCLVLVDARQGPEPTGDASEAVRTLTEKVSGVVDALSSFISRGSVAIRDVGKKTRALQRRPFTVPHSTDDEDTEHDYVQIPDKAEPSSSSLSPEPLLVSPTALENISSALTSSISYLRTQAKNATSTATLRLASVARSGLELLGIAVGDEVDASLVPVKKRLEALREALLTIRNERNWALGKMWSQGSVGDGSEEIGTGGTAGAVVSKETAGTGKADLDAAKPTAKEPLTYEWRKEGLTFDSYEMRTQLSALDEIDALRDELGNFCNDKGEAPILGQALLRALLEECYCLAYDLVG